VGLSEITFPDTEELIREGRACDSENRLSRVVSPAFYLTLINIMKLSNQQDGNLLANTDTEFKIFTGIIWPTVN
jgi:hypothetical protein